VSVVVDASALVALANREPGWEAIEALIVSETNLWASSANLLEAGLVLTARGETLTPDAYWRWLAALGVRESERSLARDALAAYHAYGRGFHPARLNLGDCFAYALARQMDAGLLYTGGDILLTDVKPAL
jgi:ribonuclease VapC